MSKNLRALASRKGLTNSLFGEITRKDRPLSENGDNYLKELADKYLVGKSTVLSASSFYDFLSVEHTSKKVLICDGTACLTSGKSEKFRASMAQRFSHAETGSISCLGLCHTKNAFMIDNVAYALPDGGDPDDILNTVFPENLVFNPGTNAEKPALIAPYGELKEYYGIIGKYTGALSDALKEIELSALRGRGGAGFPFHIKLKTTREIVSEQKYVVCNADEGDPGSFSDKWLLEERPHSVLFGMIITGLIIGANTGAIYVRGEYPEAVKSVRNAIREFEEGKCIDQINKEFTFKFHLFEGAGAYICGEETALLNSIEGLRPEVRSRPPFPAKAGLYGKPTILANVETFANLRYILNEGGEAYSSMGTRNSTGTKLVSLDGGFNKPGIYEIKFGTSFKEVLEDFGGGTKYPVKAYQVGGPLGGVIPSWKTAELTLDFESFSKAGFLLGHGGVVSIPDDFPVIKLLLHLFEFALKESCGKCFPCRIGSEQGFELLKGAVEKGRKIDRTLFSDLLETMQLASLCALGGGISLPVVNSLDYFSKELDEYFNK